MSTKAVSRTVSLMEKGCLHTVMAMSLKEILNIIISVEKERKLRKMAGFMKGIFIMINSMEMVDIILVLVMFMKENFVMKS